MSSTHLSALRGASTPATLRLSRRAGFWAIALSFFIVTAFSTAPSSLYGLYEQRDHLSSLAVTLAYAVYAVGVLASLVLVGHVSDWYGRRVVLLPAIAVAIVAAVLFLTWTSFAGLLAARVLTGVAVGAIAATATAFIADLDAGPGGVATGRAGIVATIANIGGLASGPLIAGLLATYAPHGLTLPFAVFLAASRARGACRRTVARGSSARSPSAEVSPSASRGPGARARAVHRRGRRCVPLLRRVRGVRGAGGGVPGGAAASVTRSCRPDDLSDVRRRCRRPDDDHGLGRAPPDRGWDRARDRGPGCPGDLGVDLTAEPCALLDRWDRRRRRWWSDLPRQPDARDLGLPPGRPSRRAGDVLHGRLLGDIACRSSASGSCSRA